MLRTALFNQGVHLLKLILIAPIDIISFYSGALAVLNQLQKMFI